MCYQNTGSEHSVLKIMIFVLSVRWVCCTLWQKRCVFQTTLWIARFFQNHAVRLKNLITHQSFCLLRRLIGLAPQNSIALVLIVCPLLSRSTFYKNLLSKSTFLIELLLDHFQSHTIKSAQCNILDPIYRVRDAPRTLLSTRTSWPTRTTASASSTAPSDASTTTRCRL